MRFQPRQCPRPDCNSRLTRRFRWRRKGYFTRRCDGRAVQRFMCLECKRGFSVQTFRVDYRLRRPRLHLALFRDFVSKTTMRQSARTLGCTRRTVAHRLKLLGEHCRAFHQAMLARARVRGGIAGVFQLDELEGYEHSRRLKPLTMPVLIERRSYFVLHAECAPLPARGRLSAGDQKKKEEQERVSGKRRSGSVEAVRRSFEVLACVHRPSGAVLVQTDRKSTYATRLRRMFADRLLHERHSSSVPRNYTNPLFPINHTLAMLRDGISRLVRRTWAASKLRERLELHVWIWIAYRNYMRSITNRAAKTTSAMALGIDRRQWKRNQLLAWRVLESG